MAIRIDMHRMGEPNVRRIGGDFVRQVLEMTFEENVSRGDISNDA